ncbi:MAG: serine hydrolase [Micropruina sp.]
MNWLAHYGVPLNEFSAAFERSRKDGWRLEWLQVFEDGGSARVNAVWAVNDGRSWEASYTVAAADLEDRFRQQVDRGLRLRCTGAYVNDGQIFFADLWDDAPSPGWRAHHNISLAHYQSHFDQLRAEGWALVHLNACAWGDDALFSTIWESGHHDSWASEHFLSDPEFQQRVVTAGVLGRQLTMACPYSVGGEARWAVIWGPRTLPFEARHGRSGADFRDDFEDLRLEGFRPLSIAGCATTGQGDRYTAVLVNDALPAGTWNTITDAIDTFLDNQTVPGLSLAMAYDGRLVFATTRGHADIDKREALRTRHRMRVASLSKPITSVAVHRLIESGRLALTDTVFGAAGILGTTYGTLSYSADQLNVTVEHLLTHTSGGWDYVGPGHPEDIDGMDDPMFTVKGDQTALIGQVLDTYPLRTPGSVYAYSNFGYCLLGRIIERKTGQSYADAVQALVFRPIGAQGLTIAGNTKQDRQTDEVQYVGDGDDPYNLDVARMDAHGGWVSSAISMVRFGIHVSGDGDKLALLDAGQITSMMNGSAANSSYGHGWGVSMAGARNHFGGLKGTTTALESDPATLTTWAVLVNTRPSTKAAQDSLRDDLLTMMRGIAGASWPGHDFFEDDPRQPGIHERVEDPPVIFHPLPHDEKIDLEPPVILNPVGGQEHLVNKPRPNPFG